MDQQTRQGHTIAAGSHGDVEIVIRMDRSLDPEVARLMYATFVAVLLVIAAGFWMVGAWLVLPFAGLEVALVTGVLVYLGWHRDDRDVVTVSGNSLTVTRMRGRRAEATEFHRQWATVRLSPGRYDWYPSRLCIRGHGREVEIAAGVVEERRRELAGQLAQLLGTAYKN